MTQDNYEIDNDTIDSLVKEREKDIFSDERNIECSSIMRGCERDNSSLL